MLVWWLIVKKGATITTRIINHEKIHQKQQFEMFIVFFFLWYGIEFAIRSLFQYWNWSKAYRNISFEREAYTNEDNISYLSSRNRFAWFNYLRSKNYD